MAKQARARRDRQGQGDARDWRGHRPWAPPAGWPATGGTPADGAPRPLRQLPYHRAGNRFSRGPRGDGPLRRDRDDSMVGGVAAGLAAKYGWDVTVIRTLFVLAGLVSGLGAAPYVLAWLLVPAQGESRPIATTAVTDKRGIGQAAALASVIVVVLLVVSSVGVSWFGPLGWPLVITVPALVLIWRNAPPAEQAVLQRFTQPVIGMADGTRRSRLAFRIVIALVLAGAGVGLLLTLGHKGRLLLPPIGGLALVIAGLVVAFGPWWLRVARDLVVERQARARAEERADMASRVHDSVLQTLALIQRRADDPQQVTALARAQERELRSWLFDGRAPGLIEGADLTLGAGVRQIQQEIEAQHGIAVEVVLVGDCELDADLRALLAAGREATVNSAKWSGAPVVSVFAEVEPGAVSLYVRDRGQGFDPERVPADRKGLAQSVHARMARRGGTASVRTAPGEGTEVSLRMPRSAAPAQAAGS
jgi:signal transduction histidine kinase/phage shock protein PspC (stress-responsive transcriptional regulator)